MKNLKKYLITDPLFYTNDKIRFKNKLVEILQNNKIDIACFRDKESPNFEELAEIFVDVCKNFNIKTILINTNYELAYKLNASGVHLTSSQFEQIKKAKELNLYTIISCHTLDEIEKAVNLNIDVVTFSPIFSTPNKGEAKGIDKLEEAINLFKNTKIIALGGIIDEHQIKQISQTKAYGFASIRYFI